MCGFANVQMCEFFSAVSPIEFAHSHISKSAHFIYLSCSQEE